MDTLSFGIDSKRQVYDELRANCQLAGYFIGKDI